jgi:predicted nuclease of predicted toxin-antitoxin system
MKKIKLDENFPPSLVHIFRLHGIDASSVHEQNMNGTDDDKLFEICIAEERAIITFDLDLLMSFDTHRKRPKEF